MYVKTTKVTGGDTYHYTNEDIKFIKKIVSSVLPIIGDEAARSKFTK